MENRNKQNGSRRRGPSVIDVDQLIADLAEAESQEEREHLTDVGNARRLVSQHGQDVRYFYPLKCWFVWDGQRWLSDNTGEVVRRAKETVRSILTEARMVQNPNRQKGIIAHAMRSEKSGRISGMLTMAQSEHGIPILSDDLDSDDWLLNCENGTLNLKTAELGPHRREDLITKIAATGFDPSALCPRWETFLNEIFAGNCNLIDFAQRMVGYSLTGDDREEVIFFLHGTGANGKTTFTNILRQLLGDYAQQAAPDLLLMKKHESHPTGVADLQGSRLVVTSEVDQGKHLAEAMVKQLTGRDRQKARKMRRDFFEFDMKGKIFLTCNHRPIIQGNDIGIWRRIVLVPFEVTFAESKQDKELQTKLRQEFPGILAWAVRGSLAWQKQGLDVPNEVKAATLAYRGEMDWLAQFLDERCEIEASSKIQTTELYKAMERWCSENGEEPISQKMLAEELSHRGFQKGRVGHPRHRYWFGLQLRKRDLPIQPQDIDSQKRELDEQHQVFLSALPAHLVWSEQQFEDVWKLHPNESDVIIAGKRVKTPRWWSTYGAAYTFSGQTTRALRVPSFLQTLLEWGRVTIHRDLNGLLVNWYDGARKHYIGPHHDSVEGMMQGTPIVTISFGEERIFRMTKEQGKGKQKRVADRHDILALNGTVVIIPFQTNLTWKHGVPHFSRYQGRRISVTMRAFHTV